MRKPVFTGSGVAIVTPFLGETVNYKALKALLDFHLANHTDAIIVCGTTGEAATMTPRERMKTIETCVEHVNGRIPVIAGTGSNSTETAVAQSKEAERIGADGLLVVTPYYNKATQEGLLRHYRAVADSVSRPIILYDVPSRTGVTIAPETYAALARHPNVNGVKEAGGNLGNIQKTRNLCPEDFTIWSGNDDEIVPICALGGKGVISVAANLLPREIHELVQVCSANDYTSAGQMQLHLKELCDALFCEVNPIPVKTAMQMLGWPVGGLRLPLCEASEHTVERLRWVLPEYGLSLPE